MQRRKDILSHQIMLVLLGTAMGGKMNFPNIHSFHRKTNWLKIDCKAKCKTTKFIDNNVREYSTWSWVWWWIWNFLKTVFCWACFVLFEMRSCYKVQIGLELLMDLALPLSTRFTGVSYQAWFSDFVEAAQNAWLMEEKLRQAGPH